MASINQTRGRYVRGIATVLGVMVILSFVMILIAATPGKEMLVAHGTKDSNPISSLTNVYSHENVTCAFTGQGCNLFS
jgi:hypothetical protein